MNRQKRHKPEEIIPLLRYFDAGNLSLDLAKLGDYEGAEWAKLNKRQVFKYRNLNRCWLSWLYWFVFYIVKKVFLDGKIGLHFTSLKRSYFRDIQLKINEGLKRRLVRRIQAASATGGGAKKMSFGV